MASSEALPTSLLGWAALILRTADPAKKVEHTNTAAALWRAGGLARDHVSAGGDGETAVDAASLAPDQPARDKAVEVVHPSRMKLGKGGTLKSRVAILHSLANIEQWAIDLAWDIIVRFGRARLPDGSLLPDGFFDDFLQVALDEAKHFSLLDARLKELGAAFGDLPVHHGLWQSAHDTAHSLLARLAVVHMVHEARGLDVTPNTIEKFRRSSDLDSVAMLEVIYKEEITHVAAGLKWFQYCLSRDPAEADGLTEFHAIVRQYFHGVLKPPFNTEARSAAGMTEEWYMPLVTRPSAARDQ